jgi:uncharacterized protein (TIGR03089 family)
MNAVPADLAVNQVPAALVTAMADDTGRSLLTYIDDATGEHVALSAAMLGSWAARTANLLVDGCGLGRGAHAAILSPPHWQSAAVLLGAWSVGVSADVHLAATAGLPRIGKGTDEPTDVVFVTLDRLDDWLVDVPEAPHRFVLGLDPSLPRPAKSPDFGAAVPDGYRDYLAEVRAHRDVPPPYDTIRGTDPATIDGTNYLEWSALAREMAAAHDLRSGDRVLIDANQHDHPLIWLLAPLTVGASVVLCVNLDHDAVPARIRSEGITKVL